MHIFLQERCICNQQIVGAMAGCCRHALQLCAHTSVGLCYKAGGRMKKVLSQAQPLACMPKQMDFRK